MVLNTSLPPLEKLKVSKLPAEEAILNKLEALNADVLKSGDYDEVEGLSAAMEAVGDILRMIDITNRSQVLERLRLIAATRFESSDIAGTPRLPYHDIDNLIDTLLSE